jgi:hypothetical protein
MTRLSNPTFYIERTSDNFPLQTSLPGDNDAGFHNGGCHFTMDGCLRG